MQKVNEEFVLTAFPSSSTVGQHGSALAGWHPALPVPECVALAWLGEVLCAFG